MKRSRVLLATGIVLSSILVASVASAGGALFQGFSVVDVKVNGELVQSDVPAINFYGRTLLPLRKIAEIAGLDVKWDAATNTADLTAPAGGNLTQVQAELAATKAELEGYLKANKPSQPMPITVTSKEGLAFTLHGIELTKSLGQFDKAEAGKVFAVADVSIYNGTNASFKLNPLYVRVADQDARLYTMAFASVDGSLELVTLAPGERIRGRQAFLLPESTPVGQVRLSMDVFNEAELILKVR